MPVIIFTAGFITFWIMFGLLRSIILALTYTCQKLTSYLPSAPPIFGHIAVALSIAFFSFLYLICLFAPHTK
jgi:predicted metal-binding membrane protein